MTIHLKTMDLFYRFIRIYGITKDPGTNKYMMVLKYMRDGNLRDYLKNHFDNIDWNNQLHYLFDLTIIFKYFHESDILHQDFHPGNILSKDFKNYLYVSD